MDKAYENIVYYRINERLCHTSNNLTYINNLLQ